MTGRSRRELSLNRRKFYLLMIFKRSRFCFIHLQLHLAALSSLRGEISELHARLQRAAQDRETLEQALAKTQVTRISLKAKSAFS